LTIAAYQLRLEKLSLDSTAYSINRQKYNLRLDLTPGPLAPAISAAAAVGVRRNFGAFDRHGERFGASLAARRQA